MTEGPLLVGGIDDGGDLRDERFLLEDVLLVGGIDDGGDLRDDDGGDLRDDDVEVLLDGCFFFREFCFRGFLEVGLTSIELPARLRSDPAHEFLLLPVMAVLVENISEIDFCLYDVILEFGVEGVMDRLCLLVIVWSTTGVGMEAASVLK